jgi:hypothetical protein
MPSVISSRALSCDAGYVRVSWSTPGATDRALVAPAAEDDRRLVDQLVALAEAVTQPAATEPEPIPLPEETPQSVTASDRPASVEVQQSPPVERGRSDEPAKAVPSQPDEAKPLGALVLGAAGELWATEAAGVVGLRAGLGHNLGSEVLLFLMTGFETSVEQPDGIGARQFSIALELELARPRWLLLAIGAGVSGLIVDVPPEIAPTSGSSIVPILTFRATVPLNSGNPVVALGPALRLYERYREVRIDGMRALRIPAQTAALLLDVRFEF